MSKANKIFKVLVTKGDLPAIAADEPLDNLQVGQIGVFAYEDNKSIDGTDLAKARKFYLAVGTDKDGDGIQDSVEHSRATHIQLNNVRHYNLRCYTPAQAQIFDIVDFKPECESEYCLKVMMASGDTYTMYGPNNPFKTFVVRTGCCEGCTGCPSGDCVELAKLLVKEVNKDVDKLFTASFVEYVTVPGIATPLADEAAVDAFVLANPDACVGVRVTTNPAKLNAYCCINLKYNNLRSIKLTPTLGCGFECNGKIVPVQEMGYEEGAAVDLAQLEYEAAGFENPYRVSSLNLVPVNVTEGLVVKGEKYTQLVLEYDQFSESGWGEYLNDQSTIIAIPCTDTTTLSSLVTVLDAILINRLDVLIDDAALCTCDANKTEDKDNATDGINI